MKKHLMILVAVLISSEALADTETEAKKQFFESSLLLEPIIEKCSEKFGQEYQSTYARWANNNITYIMEGLELLKSELGDDLSESDLTEIYQPQINEIIENLEKENIDSLKEKCDSALLMLSQ
ncbi:hypothetical protein [Permianibacter aggregans]|uniref:Uncharacterized protein n=1 Tax=Permianibacter aggregans TaxID=1510150 RepID=A0A4R6UTM2_9GAMM|nr:hypothetical protein [Permianibacter aggregans]QGX40122.1 hypothetical protein E2H98_10750 [Permianibacter aggregans]TDQ49063.1 hypothetical protein EV696_10537 [Permianibacter aggregans]